MRLVTSASDVDVEILGFRDQQQLIDLVAQDVLLAVAHGFLQAQPGDAVLAQSGFERLVLPLHFAFGNDVAVDLTNDFFDDAYVRGGKPCRGREKRRGKSGGAYSSFILASAGRHPRPASELQPQALTGTSRGDRTSVMVPAAGAFTLWFGRLKFG